MSADTYFTQYRVAAKNCRAVVVNAGDTRYGGRILNFYDDHFLTVNKTDEKDVLAVRAFLRSSAS